MASVLSSPFFKTLTPAFDITYNVQRIDRQCLLGFRYDLAGIREGSMQIVASDLMALYLPSLCAGRVIHRLRGEEEAEPTEFDEVLQELGRRHEQEHLQSLGTVVDLSRVPQEGRFTKTQEAMEVRAAVI